MENLTPNIDDDSLLVTGNGIEGLSLSDFISNIRVQDYEAFLNMSLYKYYSMSAIAPMLTNEKLYIDRVNTWEDVYENFFLKARFYSHTTGQTVDTKQYSNNIFGQSWTSVPETDAMWRIYSYDKLGVRIQTSVKKILSAVFVDNHSLSNTWLREVNYEKQEDIYASIIDYTSKNKVGMFNQLMPSTLFYKRKEFEHEHEFRLIKTIGSEWENKANFFKRLSFKININDFIESFLLDPRLDDAAFEKQKKNLIDLGADSSKISRSPLYKFTPLKIDLD